MIGRDDSMNPLIVIRSETEADAGMITGVTAAAFETLEISNHTEQFIIPPPCRQPLFNFPFLLY